MATKKSSFQHDPVDQLESIISAGAGFLAQKGVKMILEELISDSDSDTDRDSDTDSDTDSDYDDDDDDLPQKGAEKIFYKTLSAGAGFLTQKGLEMLFDAIRKGNEEKTTKALEYKTDEASEEHMKTVKALQECLKELEEPRQRERQLQEKLEKKQGKKEGEISSAEMISKFQQVLQRIETLEERLQKLPESS